MRGAVTTEEIDGIRYIWLRTLSYPENGPRRALNIFSFTHQLYPPSRWMPRGWRPDAVIASSTYPLDNAPAHRIARRFDARLIYEVHDLWPLSPVELGDMSPRHPFIMLMQWAENYAYRHADHVVSMIPKAEGHMREHGLPPGRFAYVPNGIDVDEWEVGADSLPDHHRAILDELGQKGLFLVAYAGAHGVANALDSLVDAAVELQNEGVRIVFVGPGLEKERLVARALRLGLGNVVFLPSVPKQAVPSLLSRMDALYIGLQRTPLFRFGISPNKLMDYMMAGKPVIQAIDAGNDMVVESDCGISVPPEDAQATANAIRHLRGLSATERQTMGQRGREYVLKHHDYRVLARRFLDVMQSGRADAQGEPS
jgi:glycosyltransferase involved in cell wall biosynthesis